jgi:hypothetical protein
MADSPPRSARSSALCVRILQGMAKAKTVRKKTPTAKKTTLKKTSAKSKPKPKPRSTSRPTSKSKPTATRTPKPLPGHVEMAMRNAGLAADARDPRGLMPLAEARALLKGLDTVVRGEGRTIGGIHVWDSDRAWAALLSLQGPEDLYRHTRLEWKMPPRGLDNPAVAERYGDHAVNWVSAMLDRGSLGPGFACLGATLLAAGASGRAFDCAVRLDAQRPDQLFLWQWLRKHPAHWALLAVSVRRGARDRVEALGRVAATDAKGAFAAIAAAVDEGAARDAFAKGGLAVPAGFARAAGDGTSSKRTAISLGAIEPHFLSFAYPMWDNANYFTGAMRVTGFVCDAGEALVWEQLATGLGEGSLRREVTVHASFPVKHTWLVHTETLLEERAILGWDGDDEISLLTGVRRKGRDHVAPADGIRTRAAVPKLGRDVPLAIDTVGLDEDERKLLAQTGPAERLLVRLGQPPYRDEVFAPAAQLAKEACLPDGARSLFQFDVFEMPRACEAAGSAPDVVAMVDALAAREPIVRLPSAGRHPLRGLLDRVRALGGWGDAKLCAPG